MRILGLTALLALASPAFPQDPVAAGGTVRLLSASRVTDGVEIFGLSTELWRTLDGGATSEPIASPTSSSLTEIVCDGAGVFYARDDGQLWRSVDAGATWSTSPSPSGVFGNLPSAFDVSVVSAGEQWFGQYSDVFASTNSGVAWSPVLSIPSGRVTQIRAHPTRPGVVAVLASVGSFPDSVHHSSDGGVTWTTTSLGASGVGFVRRMELAGDSILLQGIDTLWMSVDAGATWTASRSWQYVNGGESEVAAVKADPGIDGRVAFVRTYGDFYESLDGGGTWSNVVGAPTSMIFTNVLEFSPAGEMLLGTSSLGVLRQDAGAQRFRCSPSGSRPLGFAFARYDPSNPSRIVAAADLGSAMARAIMESTDSGLTWMLAADGPRYERISEIEVSPDGVVIVAGAVAATDSNVGTVVAAVHRYVNGSWMDLGLPGAAPFPFSTQTLYRTISGLAVSEGNPGELYVCVGSPSPALHRTLDGGGTWQTEPMPLIPPPVGAFNRIHSMALLEGTLAPRLVFTIESVVEVGPGPFGGTSFIHPHSASWTDDFGATLNSVPGSYLGESTRSRVAASRLSPRVAYMGGARYGDIVGSVDGMTTAVEVDRDTLEDLVVGSRDTDLLVRVDENNVPGGTTAEVFVSRNGGVDWTSDGVYGGAYLSNHHARIDLRHDDAEALVAHTTGIARIGLEAEVGAASCGPATTNVRGLDARIQALGSSSVLDGTLRLRAHRLPINSFGLFLTSQTLRQSPVMPAGSFGRLCLDGSIGRFNSSLSSSMAMGELHLAVNLAALPQGLGTQAVLAGEAWSFQAWFRDRLAGQAGSNFTDAVTVVFR